MPRVLIIAYRFPPDGGIGSIRASSFAAQLPRLGWDVRVIAPARTPHDADPSLPLAEETVVRSRSIELSRIGGALPSSAVADGARGRSGVAAGLRGAARLIAHRIVYFPDAQIGWYPGAVRVGLGLLDRERFDVIYSSSGPMTSHLVAGTLSRRSGLPWVVEFRDPWSDALPRLPYRRMAAGLEQRIARRASRVVMPSPAWAGHFGQRWNVDVEVIPNGSDLLPDVGGPHPASTVVAHVGSYYPGQQSLRVAWQALADLRRTGHPTARLRWVGELPSAARDELAEFGLQDAVNVTGFVPHEEATRLLRSSSVLIASGPVDRGVLARGWLPAKVFEYIASGLPVLFVGDPEGDAAMLLALQPGCRVVAPDDASGARAALSACLNDEVRARDASEISRSARAHALANVLSSAINGG